MKDSTKLKKCVGTCEAEKVAEVEVEVDLMAADTVEVDTIMAVHMEQDQEPATLQTVLLHLTIAAVAEVFPQLFLYCPALSC